MDCRFVERDVNQPPVGSLSSGTHVSLHIYISACAFEHVVVHMYIASPPFFQKSQKNKESRFIALGTESLDRGTSPRNGLSRRELLAGPLHSSKK